MTLASFNRRKARWFVLSSLAVGAVLGFGLDSLGLLPVPQIDFRWTIPALRGSEYVPSATLNPGKK